MDISKAIIKSGDFGLAIMGLGIALVFILPGDTSYVNRPGYEVLISSVGVYVFGAGMVLFLLSVFCAVFRIIIYINFFNDHD